MTNRQVTAFLFLLAAVLFGCAACATPEATIGAIAAVGASAGTLVKMLEPILTPEMAAKLMTVASSIDGTAQSTSQAVGIIADAIGTMKGTVGSQIAAQADGLAKAVQQLSTFPTRTEMMLQDAGIGSASVGAARLLSHFKHSPAAKT